MKVLVLGYSGQLGRCLHDQLKGTGHKVIYTTRNEIDIVKFQDMKSQIEKIAPNVIINATAYTAVDKAEQEQQNADLINHLAVANIAHVCSQVGCWLVHVSTDYVFDGVSEVAYKEIDKPNPQNVYGDTKLKGELAVQSSGCKHIIIRTAWVFSEYGNNFLKTVLRLGAERTELRVVGDQIGCPTYAQDIAAAIVVILGSLESNELDSDLYHFGGNACYSWAEFAKVIFDEALELKAIMSKPNIVAVTTEEFPTQAKRPASSRLNSNKIGFTFGIDASDIVLGIRSTLMAVKKEAF